MSGQHNDCDSTSTIPLQGNLMWNRLCFFMPRVTSSVATSGRLSFCIEGFLYASQLQIRLLIGLLLEYIILFYIRDLLLPRLYVDWLREAKVGCGFSLCWLDMFRWDVISFNYQSTASVTITELCCIFRSWIVWISLRISQLLTIDLHDRSIGQWW